MSGVTSGVAASGAAVTAGAAGNALPFTGLGVVIYVLLAVLLITSGLVLRHIGARGAARRAQASR
jgi:hypothetical protein